ncbi:hypothetical protein Syun_030313 [Stephania yunnanensis]|uniref:Omega-hydroxypalmitate O-feruloyl transferase n=1 Tax=Stephania yunnanensis TaxID=152371 RepID=A0AAP0E7A8_9MAGN
MDSLHHAPSPTDLKVTIHRHSKVFPSKKIERRTMFLSNIDQVLDFYVGTVHFFEANDEFPPEKVAERLEKGLGEVLVAYDFLAGRLSCYDDGGGDEKMSRLELDCNSAGVGFAVASSEFCLNEIGDLVFPNPCFRQLVLGDLEKLSIEDRPLCVFQVTSFKCGGFAIGVSSNHTTLDGKSFKAFLENLASLTANKPMVSTPCHDRRLLAARSPPHITFSHLELVPFEAHPSIFQEAQNLDIKLFQLSSDDILKLKSKAKCPTTTTTTIDSRKITSFNVLTAHVWRCKALSGDTQDLEKASTLLYAVDIRSRLNPPLPPTYCGNAVISASANLTLGELREAPFSLLVDKVFEGATRITDEYARSVIDWGETHKGLPLGDLLVSSWWKLGFADVDYAWGRPKYSCPLVVYRKDIVLFFPDIQGVAKGVNVMLALPSEEMVKFQNLFHKFLD